ncbi:MAG: hypothetical protein WC770_09400 [Phycisphaerae bacterium]
MTDSEKVKRFGLDKIGFFVLLLAGVLCAKLVVSSQTNFKLSKPVLLEGTGVSAAIPRGGGFQQISEGFSYEDNEFRLGAVLRVGREAAVSVHWRYFLLPIEQAFSERFAEEANSLGGVVEYSKSQQFGQLTFDCAKIVAAKTATVLLTGTTVLPDGRTLTLEVAQKGRDFDIADNVFNSVIASAEFKAENSRADGIKFLENFRQTDFADIAGKKTEQNYYYIEDFTDKKLGFSTDAVGKVTDSSKVDSVIAATLYFFQSGMISRAEQDLFAGEPNIHTFKWGNRQSDLLINREIPTTIKLDDTGMITIQKRTGMQNFANGRSMLPEILFDCAIESFLRSSFDAVMLDMIISDGTIRPIIIKKAKAEADKFPELKITKAVEVKFLGSGTDAQTIYLNDANEMLMSEIRGTVAYRLRKTDKENIIADFPEWTEKIEQLKGYTVAADANGNGDKKKKK